MKKLLKILNKHNSSSGFTLIELLIAAAITTIVVGVAGSGLVAITSKNRTVKAETDRRVELNRALDFMTDEVRQATNIATNASTDLGTVASNFNTSSKTPVLTLQIPNVSQRIIYYIASPSSNWLGPRVIYRWGPNPDNGDTPTDGTYTNPTLPANWTYEPLIDLIEDSSLSPSCGTTVPALNPSSGVTGFYACVASNGRAAQVYLRGRLTGAYNNTTAPLEVSTKVFARSAVISPAALAPPTTPPFTTLPDGTLTVNEPSDAVFQVLGGSMDCYGTEIPTTTTINVTPSGGTTTSTTMTSSNRSVTAAAGTTLSVTGFADNSICYGSPDHTFRSDTDVGRQVLSLRNGDRPPIFTPYGSQPALDTFLTAYLNPDGTVKLAANQVIFLYELFTTNRTDPTYDMQDLVVLATISPT